MPNEHLTFGGSSIHRSLACPGWVNEAKGLPRPESEYAKIGTALHTCMEDILLDGVSPDEFAGICVEGVDITQQMVNEKLHPAADMFDQLCDEQGVTEYEAETFVSIADDVGGTADFVCAGRDAVIIGDFKFGDGIQVDPEENAQGLFYAMCAQADKGLADFFKGRKTVVVAIIQPNDRGLPDLRTWACPVKRLVKFRQQVERAVKEAKSARPPINAGSHCTFCPAASVCPEKTGQALRALRMQPDDIECLSDSLELVGDLKKWITAVEKTAFEQLNAGVPIAGWKLVAKRATAKWKDADAVIQAFRRRLGGIKSMTKTTILSPAQLKKVAAERGVDIDFDEYIVKTSSGNTLAPEDDKRPAVVQGEALREALKSIK